MEYRTNPDLAADISRFQDAGLNISKCFNCGTCTAVCGHAEAERSFPRRMIRFAQVGLEGHLLESLEPWLCYYCGQCSTTCPREAMPGEMMMTLRRWLTSRYDWTGVSRRLYLSTAWEVGMLSTVALIVLALFVVPGLFGVPFGFAAISADAVRHVRLDLFAPKAWIHIADWTLALGLLLLLGINAGRMVYFVRRGQRNRPVPPSAWFTEAYQLIVHGLTQKGWLACENGVRRRWLLHVLLMSGYATMFLLVVLFLPAFQRDGAELHYTSIFGYYGTVALLVATTVFMRDRIKKGEEIAKYLARHRLDVPAPAVPDRAVGNRGEPRQAARSPVADLHPLRRPPDDRGADAGRRGTVRQVAAPGVPAGLGYLAAVAARGRVIAARPAASPAVASS